MKGGILQMHFLGGFGNKKYVCKYIKISNVGIIFLPCFRAGRFSVSILLLFSYIEFYTPKVHVQIYKNAQNKENHLKVLCLGAFDYSKKCNKNKQLMFISRWICCQKTTKHTANV
jgi:hypothetical protein